MKNITDNGNKCFLGGVCHLTCPGYDKKYVCQTDRILRQDLYNP